MDLKEKTKEKLDDAGKEIKTAIDNLGKEVADLSKKIKEKFKGAGEEVKETAEELSKEVKRLSERAKDLIPKRSKADQLPVRVQNTPAPRSQGNDHPFFELQRATNRLFDDFFRDFGFPSTTLGEPLSLTGEFLGAKWPRVDMSETEKDINITAELAGVDKDGISIAINEGRITISGEKKEEEEERGKGYYHYERSYGSFQRTFALPCEIDENKVDASFKDGLLKITLPKSEKALERIKKIEVKAG